MVKKAPSPCDDGADEPFSSTILLVSIRCCHDLSKSLRATEPLKGRGREFSSPVSFDRSKRATLRSFNSALVFGKHFNCLASRGQEVSVCKIACIIAEKLDVACSTTGGNLQWTTDISMRQGIRQRAASSCSLSLVRLGSVVAHGTSTAPSNGRTGFAYCFRQMLVVKVSKALMK